MKINNYIFYLFILLAIMLSCDDSDVTRRVNPDLTVQKDLLAKPTTSREVITLHSSYPWFAEASESWIKLQKYRGQALKEDSIVAIIEENPEMEDRQGWIEIRLMDQLREKIEVKQEGRGSLITLSKNLIYFNVNGGETILDVYTHMDWDTNFKEEDGYTLTKLEKNKLKVNVAQNTTGSERNKTVVLSSKENEEKATLNIVQTEVEKMLSIPLSAEEKDMIFLKEGDNLDIPVSLNVTYDCIASDQWIKVNETPNFSGDIVQDITIKAAVDPNTTGEERNGYIVVKDKGTENTVTDTVYVSQRARNRIIYVNAGSGGDGTTWDMAFGTIEEGMGAADHAGDMEIWVAEGIYQLKSTMTWKSVNVYGGFKGTERKIKDRDGKSKSTIKGGDFYPLIQAWNAVPENAWYCMDGFIFTGINAPNKQGVGALEIYQRRIMRNCIFKENISGKNTAGYYQNCKLINCLIADNTTTLWTATLQAQDTELYNVAIVNNKGNPTLVSPGIRINGTKSVLYNTIIWGNKAGNLPQAYLDANGNSTFINTAVEGGFKFNSGNSPRAVVDCIELDSENSTTTGPGFVNVNNQDYHLQPISPLINTGINNPNKLQIHTDLDGLKRIIGDQIDIGPYEYQTK